MAQRRTELSGRGSGCLADYRRASRPFWARHFAFVIFPCPRGDTGSTFRIAAWKNRGSCRADPWRDNVQFAFADWRNRPWHSWLARRTGRLVDDNSCRKELHYAPVSAGFDQAQYLRGQVHGLGRTLSWACQCAHSRRTTTWRCAKLGYLEAGGFSRGGYSRTCRWFRYRRANVAPYEWFRLIFKSPSPVWRGRTFDAPCAGDWSAFFRQEPSQCSYPSEQPGDVAAGQKPLGRSWAVDAPCAGD